MQMSEQQHLLSRLDTLESEAEIRRVISQYMHLCDDLRSEDSVTQIGQLFTCNAEWAGIGELYAERLGNYKGRAAIEAMMRKYVTHPAHFRLNTHYLSSEFIYLNEINEATGRWKMLQLSTFNNGQSHLNGAELIIEFRRENNIWLINHFTTRNLFSRPIDYWHSPSGLPVPETKRA